jgi:hypothetical protein
MEEKKIRLLVCTHFMKRKASGGLAKLDFSSNEKSIVAINPSHD